MTVTALLTTDDVDCRFGGVQALNKVSISIDKGATVGLIGPNGAGKSTLLNCMTGYYQPTGGSIVFDGRSAIGARPRELCRRGITRSFQNLAMFDAQSVRDNVLFGAYLTATGSGARARRTAVLEQLERVLVDLELTDVADSRVGDLPYPMRKRIEFGRSLMASPRLMLLDEPTSGMGVEDSHQFTEMLAAARSAYDLTLAVVAHDMAFVFRICDSVYVMDAGRVIFHGDPTAVRQDPEVRRVYLGERR